MTQELKVVGYLDLSKPGTIYKNKGLYASAQKRKAEAVKKRTETKLAELNEAFAQRTLEALQMKYSKR